MSLNRFSTVLRNIFRSGDVRPKLFEQRSKKIPLDLIGIERAFCSMSTIRVVPFYSPKHQFNVTSQNNWIVRRFKQRRRSSNKEENDDDDDDDDEDDEMANENPMLMEDLPGLNDEGCRQLDIVVGTLRLDGFAKNAFSMTRSKIEELFYKGDIYVNGERPSKKSFDLSQGDEIDVVVQSNIEDPTLVDIKRVQIIKIPDKTSDTGHMKVTIKRWLELTIKPHGRIEED